MNQHARSFQRELETLGFVWQREAKAAYGTRVYVHANDPSRIIKVADAMNDNSVTVGRKLALAIVGLGSNGPQAQTLKDRARVSRQKAKSEREQQRDAARLRAEAKDRELADELTLIIEGRHQSYYEGLMRPGYGR